MFCIWGGYSSEKLSIQDLCNGVKKFEKLPNDKQTECITVLSNLDETLVQEKWKEIQNSLSKNIKTTTWCGWFPQTNLSDDFSEFLHTLKPHAFVAQTKK